MILLKEEKNKRTISYIKDDASQERSHIRGNATKRDSEEGKQ